MLLTTPAFVCAGCKTAVAFAALRAGQMLPATLGLQGIAHRPVAAPAPPDHACILMSAGHALRTGPQMPLHQVAFKQSRQR